MTDEATSNVTARMTAEQIAWLDAEAERQGTNRSAVLRDVVADGIERAKAPKLPQAKESPPHSQRCEYCEGRGQVSVMVNGEPEWWICAKCGGNGAY